MSIIRHRALGALVLAPLLGAAPARAAGAGDLTTVAGKTQFRQTGRYEEVVALCHALASRYPGKARCREFGRTPENRPMLALAVSADGTLEPAAARRRRRPVLFFVGGIHAGEIDGKDAGFALVRDLLAGQGPVAALGAATVVFVPVFNVDGHERFGPNQRPNQRGPQETGFRTTAQNLNLNRDWVKAEAPEMAAMLALLEAWDPVMLVDLHVTDGARFEHDVAILVEPRQPPPHELNEAARSLSDVLMAKLAAGGHLPLDFDPAFRKNDDPATGIEVPPLVPRFSHHYLAARNRLGILVETHSWREYSHRVRTTYDILKIILEQAQERAGAWRQAADRADQASVALAGTDVPLIWKGQPPARTVDFRGYAVTRELSPISGGTWLRYDETRPQLWHLEVIDHLAPALVVHAPGAGYLVPAAHAEWVSRKLALHGIRFARLERAQAPAEALAFRAQSVAFARAPFEGRFGAEVKGQWRPEPRAFEAGSLFVPIDQPRAMLVLNLLEPTGPDSLVSWGFFHAAFEQKEGMEDYVAEEEARKMLAHDPKLQGELDAELKRDPTLVTDPHRRLLFFYQRHPAWDQRVNLYPILRLDHPPTARMAAPHPEHRP
jgi:hypothetical protein